MTEINLLKSVIQLAKRRGFIFPSGSIYGGVRSAWDYGPLGVELKENIKKEWWRSMVMKRDDIVGLDSSIILPSQVWESSGHTKVFNDPLIECKNCNKRYRVDHLEDDYIARKGKLPLNGFKELKCIKCGVCNWTDVVKFSGMLTTNLGPVNNQESLHYLRPETAQGIFINFSNVLNTSRKKPPFGIAQIGKSFRNEITPGNFIFRTREFEQMEMEFFVKPKDDEKWMEYWTNERMNWYINLGIKSENLRFYKHTRDKLSHYSINTVDIEYCFNFQNSDFAELEGIANRTDYDLISHAKSSNSELTFFDQENKKHWTPYVIESAAGLNRALMAFLMDSYFEEKISNTKGTLEKRTVLKLDRRLSPIKVAVLPLSRNSAMSLIAKEIATDLRQYWHVDFDTSNNIGRRYRRQDEIGTPFCITTDFETEKDKTVTIRERDTMQQVRIKIDEIKEYLSSHLD